MITTLKLHSWKSYLDATLYLDPLTFIIGTNASGKSNILDALDFLKKVADGVQLKDVIPTVRGGEDWIIKNGSRDASLEVVVQDGDYSYSYVIKIGREGMAYAITGESLTRKWKGQFSKALFYTDDQARIDSPTITARFHTGKRGSARRIDLNSSTAILAQVELLQVQKDIKDGARCIREALNKVFILNPQPVAMRGFSPLSDQLRADGSNIAGVLAGMESEREKDVEDTLTRYVKPLPERDIDKVWAEKVGRYEKDAMLYCDERWTEKNVTHLDARSMSDGTLRFIAIVTALLTLKEGSLLVIEEIDNGLHPSRSEELVKMLKELGTKRGIDVLCTTHNPVLIDALGNEMIPFVSYVKRDESGASRIELVEELPNLAKLMAGHSLGDLMTKDLL